MDCKYPEIEVQLTGLDGNAYAILGRVKQALKQGGISREEIQQFLVQAMSSDYDHLLVTCMEWVTVL